MTTQELSSALGIDYSLFVRFAFTLSEEGIDLVKYSWQPEDDFTQRVLSKLRRIRPEVDYLSIFTSTSTFFDLELKRRVWRRYRKGAERSGKLWELSEELFYYLIQQECHYCGSSASNLIRSGKRWFRYNGLDRKSCKEGYSEDNVVPCCWTCNKIKGRCPYEKFVQFIKKAGSYLLLGQKISV